MTSLAFSQSPQRKQSFQMRAVLLIFGADPYLMRVVGPHIDQVSESIAWNEIFKIPLCSGHKAACLIAYSVWTDEVRARSNPFAGALNMGIDLKRACLQALALRWGLNK